MEIKILLHGQESPLGFDYEGVVKTAVSSVCVLGYSEFREENLVLGSPWGQDLLVHSGWLVRTNCCPECAMGMLTAWDQR